jgi:hypothetical protein
MFSSGVCAGASRFFQNHEQTPVSITAIIL